MILKKTVIFKVLSKIQTYISKLFDGSLLIQASAIAFDALLSVFPLLFFLTSLLGLIAGPHDLHAKLFEFLARHLPQPLFILIQSNIREILPESSIWALVLSLFLSLFTGTNALTSSIYLMNKINNIPETRSFIKLKGLTILLFLGLIFLVTPVVMIMLTLKFVLLILFPDFSMYPPLMSLLKGVFFLSMSTLVIGLFFQKGLNKKLRFKNILSGALFVSVSLFIFNNLFQLFITGIMSGFNKIYGTISSVIALLVWFQLFALLVLIGSKIVILEIKPENQL